MNVEPGLAAVAALFADGSRARMLVGLLDGEKMSTELALLAAVSIQTASAHLAKLTESGLVIAETHGRCRYYRLAGPAVTQAIDALTALAPKATHVAAAPAAASLRVARTCYDHLAGHLGVDITRAFVKRRYLVPARGGFRVTPGGARFLRRLGISVMRLGRQRRSLAPRCIDWTERRPHVGGALGAALASHCFDVGWLTRVSDARAVRVTPKGRGAFADVFGITG